MLVIRKEFEETNLLKKQIKVDMRDEGATYSNYVRHLLEKQRDRRGSALSLPKKRDDLLLSFKPRPILDFIPEEANAREAIVTYAKGETFLSFSLVWNHVGSNRSEINYVLSKSLIIDKIYSGVCRLDFGLLLLRRLRL